MLLRRVLRQREVAMMLKTICPCQHWGDQFEELDDVSESDAEYYEETYGEDDEAMQSYAAHGSSY